MPLLSLILRVKVALAPHMLAVWVEAALFIVLWRTHILVVVRLGLDMGRLGLLGVDPSAVAVLLLLAIGIALLFGLIVETSTS